MAKSNGPLVIVCIAIPAVCGIGGWLLVHGFGNSATKALTPQEAAARKLGLPTRPKDLRVLPKVPKDQDASAVYRSAALELARIKAQEAARAAVKSGPPTRLTSNPAPTPVLKTKDDFQKQADARLSSLKSLFDIVAQLDHKPMCDFGNSFYRKLTSPSNPAPSQQALSTDAKVDLAVGSTFYDLVHALRDKADFQDRHADWPGALKTMKYVFRIAKDSGLRVQPDAAFFETTLRLVGCREYKLMLDRHTHDAQFLSALGLQLKGEMDLPQLKNDLACQILQEESQIQSLESLPHPSNDHPTIDGYESDKPNEEPTEFDKRYMQSPGVREAVNAKLLDAWKLVWSNLPKDPNDWNGYSQALKLAETTVQKDQSTLNSFNRTVFVDSSREADDVGVLQARVRMLLVSIELMKIRISTAKLPVILPASLGEIRIDPFDGRPLRYHKSGTGFVLYSIGSDRTDDGGTTTSANNNGTGTDEVLEFK